MNNNIPPSFTQQADNLTYNLFYGDDPLENELGRDKKVFGGGVLAGSIGYITFGWPLAMAPATIGMLFVNASADAEKLKKIKVKLLAFDRVPAQNDSEEAKSLEYLKKQWRHISDYTETSIKLYKSFFISVLAFGGGIVASSPEFVLGGCFLGVGTLAFARLRSSVKTENRVSQLILETVRAALEQRFA